MKMFLTTQLTIPVLQMIALLSLSTLALIFGRFRLALLTNYCFIFYWTYLANENLFNENGTFKLDQPSMIYYGYGMIILLFVLVGFAYYRD